MKLNKEFIIHNTGDECFLVPTGGAGFSGLVKGNRTLGAVLELLKTETGESEVIRNIRARFDVSEDTAAKDVKTVLDNLRKIGALDE
ncbi:MAG: PqqD family protein [Oscillospiraceae bacterium]|nr:PqqD family protein [Oscillospiraceae bacterium]